MIRWERKNSDLSLLFTFSQAGKLLSFSFVRLFLLSRLFLYFNLDIVEKNKSESTTALWCDQVLLRNNSNWKSQSFPNLALNLTETFWRTLLLCFTSSCSAYYSGTCTDNETEPGELLYSRDLCSNSGSRMFTLLSDFYDVTRLYHWKPILMINVYSWDMKWINPDIKCI